MCLMEAGNQGGTCCCTLLHPGSAPYALWLPWTWFELTCSVGTRIRGFSMPPENKRQRQEEGQQRLQEGGLREPLVPAATIGGAAGAVPPTRTTSVVLPSPFRNAAIGGDGQDLPLITTRRAGGVLRNKYGGCAAERGHPSPCFSALEQAPAKLSSLDPKVCTPQQSRSAVPCAAPAPPFPAGRYRTWYDQRARTTVLVNLAGVLERCNEQTLPALYKVAWGEGREE